MNKKILIPKIRFLRFIKDWEQKKLGEVTERVKGNDGRMNLPTLTISAKSGWLDQRERFSANIAGNEQKKYTLLSKGDISYNHGNSKLAKYGVVFELKTYKEALVPRVYHSFKTTNKAVSGFIEYMFATKNPERELAKLVSSGARMDGLLNINYDDFVGIKIKIPTFEEQKEVSLFFCKLDDTITLQQQLLNDHNQLKKAMLQKMFPQKEETVPKLRFNEFKRDWEEEKLSSLFEIRDVRQVPTTEAPLMAFTSTGGVESKGDRFNREFLVKNKNKTYKRTELNDLIYSSNNLDVGAISRNKYGTAVISDVYEIFQTQSTITPIFSEIIIKEKSFLNKVLRYRQGALYGQYRIYASDFLSVDVLIPSFEEQKKIGSFFKQLDKTINLHQKKLETYQELKKAMLQKMFV